MKDFQKQNPILKDNFNSNKFPQNKKTPQENMKFLDKAVKLTVSLVKSFVSNILTLSLFTSILVKININITSLIITTNYISWII